MISCNFHALKKNQKTVYLGTIRQFHVLCRITVYIVSLYLACTVATPETETMQEPWPFSTSYANAFFAGQCFKSKTNGTLAFHRRFSRPGLHEGRPLSTPCRATCKNGIMCPLFSNTLLSTRGASFGLRGTIAC